MFPLADALVSDPNSSSHRLVLFVALLCIGLLSALSKDTLCGSLAFLIMTLGLGFRTIPITRHWRLHPAELALFGMFILHLDRRRQEGPAGPPTGRSFGLPVWVVLFIPFWLYGWDAQGSSMRSWDIRFDLFFNFVLLVPMFLTVPAAVATPQGWQRAALAIYGTSLWVAGLGLLEYLFPGVQNLFPGFIVNPERDMAGKFARAAFSFWGGADAVFQCSLFFPMGLVIWRWWPTPLARGGVLVGLFIQLAGIYVSGHRNVWLLLALQFLVYCVMRKRFLFGALTVLLMVLSFPYWPEAAVERIESSSDFASGRASDEDSSAAKRRARVDGTLEIIKANPLGLGWAETGWVHSDILMVTADLGILPGLIFLAGYLVNLSQMWGQIWRQPQDSDARILGTALLLSLVSVGGLLLLDAVVVYSWTALSVWLMWALADAWLLQAAAHAAAGLDGPFSVPGWSATTRAPAPETGWVTNEDY